MLSACDCYTFYLTCLFVLKNYLTFIIIQKINVAKIKKIFIQRNYFNHKIKFISMK